MPYYPDLTVTQQQTLMTTNFLGLNKGLSISDGEMSNMLNLTSDNYPVLTTRQKRTKVEWQSGKTTFANPHGIVGGERLVIADGSKLYVDGDPIDGITLSTADGMLPKHLVTMGAYVCVWPDKVYINLADMTDKGNMGSIWRATTQPTAEMHEEATSQRIKISGKGIGKGLKVDDVVWISNAAAVAAIADGDAATVADDDSTGNVSFDVADVSLRSRWTSTVNGGKVDHSKPSTDTVYRTVTVKGIPDGAVISGAKLYYTVAATPSTGADIRTINGETIVYATDASVDVEVKGNGDVSIPFVFKANGGQGAAGAHYAVLKIEDMRLEVTWGKSTSTSAPSEADSKAISDLNTSCRVWVVDDDYIVVSGSITSKLRLNAALTVEMRVPDFAYLTEANNRIWGCRYTMENGKLVNEIMACALGDFRNWYKYQATAADSYAVSVGSDGRFTGATTLKGYPIFFKEGMMHRIAGSTPASFQMVSTVARGVQDGCWRSIVQVGEYLYYKSRTDVMVYDGSLPQSISAALGSERYQDASGGRYSDKYYLSMQDSKGSWHLLVYDTAKGLWHREDDSEVRYFANVSGDMYFIRNDMLLSAAGQTANVEGDFDWSATFGVYGYDYEGNKYLSRFNIRAWMAKGAKMKLEIMYDSDGEWHDEGEMRSTRTTTFTLPVIPRRCDHCQLRLSGRGEMKLFSIARVLEYGGDG